MKYLLGVCSWSLNCEALESLAPLLERVGVDRVQLALNPVVGGTWPTRQVRSILEAGAIRLSSGMIGMHGEDYSTPQRIRETGGIRPTKHWKANLKLARMSALAARELGLPLVSFHAGFLPEQSSDPERDSMVARLQEIADLFADQGVRVALETGQESASTLLDVLDQVGRSNLGVNFDPANMLLYGMGDPVQALKDLAPHVFQVHVKDARASGDMARWGEEVVVGQGEVDWPGFFRALECAQHPVELMIEREAGENRVGDMRTAREHLVQLGVVEAKDAE